MYKDIDVRHNKKPVVCTKGCLQKNHALSLALLHQNDRDYDISGTNLRAPTSNTLLPHQKQRTVTSGVNSDRRFPILVSDALRNLCQSERSTKLITNLINAQKNMTFLDPSESIVLGDDLSMVNKAFENFDFDKFKMHTCESDISPLKRCPIPKPRTINTELGNSINQQRYIIRCGSQTKTSSNMLHRHPHKNLYVTSVSTKEIACTASELENSRHYLSENDISGNVINEEIISLCKHSINNSEITPLSVERCRDRIVFFDDYEPYKSANSDYDNTLMLYNDANMVTIESRMDPLSVLPAECNVYSHLASEETSSHHEKLVTSKYTRLVIIYIVINVMTTMITSYRSCCCAYVSQNVITKRYLTTLLFHNST